MVSMHEPSAGRRIDLHCHSDASNKAAEVILNAISCPECYSDPLEVHGDVAAAVRSGRHPIFDDRHASAWVPDYRRAPRVPYHPSEADFLVPDPQSIRQASQDLLWLVPMTSTTRPVWQRTRRFPYLQKVSLPANLVLNPHQLWEHLSIEIERVCAEPLVFVLRCGDLVNPLFLRNFHFITERLVAHPGLKRCRLTSVEDAVENFVKAQRQ